MYEFSQPTLDLAEKTESGPSCFHISGTNTIVLRDFDKAPFFSLRDLNGRTIVNFKQATDLHSIELPDVSEGMYLLEIQHGHTPLVLKLVL
jgi:hypothetical protein